MSTDSNVIKVQGNWFTVSKLSLFQTANQTSPSHLYIFFVNKTNRALNMYKNRWGGGRNSVVRQYTPLYENIKKTQIKLMETTNFELLHRLHSI